MENLNPQVNQPKPLLVLCLGNEIISDDGFGPEIARQLAQHCDLKEQTDIIFAPVAGFHLIDLLADREKVLIIDTIRTGKVAPGMLHSFPAGQLTPSNNLTISHQISLPVALELGRNFGAKMPYVLDLIAVEAEDLETIKEELTPPVRAAVSDAIELVKDWVSRNAMEDAKQ